jgi:hypothetical protein
MTGTTGDIIPIVIVPVVALAFCLVMIYYSDSHPRGAASLRRILSPRTRWRAASRISA